jgi:hypothetical protein
MCVLLQPFGLNLTEGNESCVCSYRNVWSIAAGIGCTLIMKKNSENAHHFTIGVADIWLQTNWIKWNDYKSVFLDDFKLLWWFTVNVDQMEMWAVILTFL